MNWRDLREMLTVKALIVRCEIFINELPFLICVNIFGAYKLPVDVDSVQGWIAYQRFCAAVPRSSTTTLTTSIVAVSRIAEPVILAQAI